MSNYVLDEVSQLGREKATSRRDRRGASKTEEQRLSRAKTLNSANISPKLFGKHSPDARTAPAGVPREPDNDVFTFFASTKQPGLQQRAPSGADRQRGSQSCSNAGH